MSGQVPDEAARLEAALARIARGAARARHTAQAARLASASLPPLGSQPLGLQPGAMHATHAAAPAGPDTAEVAARLDSLIAELRAVLGTQG